MPRRAANSKLALRGAWLATQALGLVSARLAAGPASALWFTPWRLPQSEASRAREREWLEGSRPFKVAGLKGFVAGDGPVVLLLHGWGGWASRLGAFVDPLASSGHQVIGMDLPAHGATPGRRTDPYQVTDSVLKLAGCTGPIQAVISHSVSGLVALMAMDRGLQPRSAVLLAPALRGRHIRSRFDELFRLRPQVGGALDRAIERRFGPQVWEEVDGCRIAYRLASSGRDVPILIAHDPEDPDAPFSDAQAVSQILPRAQLLTVEGTGHHRILLDEGTVAAGVEFVKSLGGTSAKADTPNFATQA